MGKTLRYGGHDFSSKKGFSGSASDGPITVRSHARARRMATGGEVVQPVVDPLHLDEGVDSNAAQVYGALNQLIPHADPGGLGGGSTGLSGPGSAQNLHEINTINAGHAPFTAKGIAQAVSNAMGVTSGLGAVETGALSMAEQAMGRKPGSLGGLQDIEGQQAFNPAEKAYIMAGGTMQGALAKSAGEQAARDHEGRAQHGGGGIGGGVDNASHAARAGFREGGGVHEPALQPLVRRRAPLIPPATRGTGPTDGVGYVKAPLPVTNDKLSPQRPLMRKGGQVGRKY